MLDFAISDTGAANALATSITNAIFNGAEALCNFLVDLRSDLMNNWNPIQDAIIDWQDGISFEIETNGAFGEHDGNTANGVENMIFDIREISAGSSQYIYTNSNWQSTVQMQNGGEPFDPAQTHHRTMLPIGGLWTSLNSGSEVASLLVPIV